MSGGASTEQHGRCDVFSIPTQLHAQQCTSRRVEILIGFGNFGSTATAKAERCRSHPNQAATLSIMARSSKLITACVALAACVALRCLAFVSGPAPAAQLRGTTPLEVAAGAAVPAVMMTPTAAMAADGEGMPSVVLGVGILCTPSSIFCMLCWQFDCRYLPCFRGAVLEACWPHSAQSPASSARR